MRIEDIFNTQIHSYSNDIKKASKEFEAFFIYYLLKIMRKTIPESGLLGSGVEKEIFTSIMDEKIANSMAERGGLGLADFFLKNSSHYTPIRADNSQMRGGSHENK